MKNPCVLVIDDEPDNFDVVETLLSDQDYLLHYAASGQEALESLDAFQPDVILLDVMMAGLDGLEVCQQIKAVPRWQAIPIIMVTALSSKEDLARCLQVGADDFISKPINSVELRARLHSMLRIKQQYDRLQSFAEFQRNTINWLGDHLQELRGNITSTLSHELNTPLTGVLGGLNLLIANLEKMSLEEIRNLLDLSYQSAYRLEQLTQRFSNYLALKLAKAQREQRESLPSNLIERIAQTQAQQLHRSDDLACHIEDAELAISPEHLQWIMNELIDNAFKFSQPGTSIVVEGQPREQFFHLWIGDRGRGMTLEQISKRGAFTQFERTSYEQQGAGLGLAIAEETIKLYGGRFLISSVYEQETSVQITLPLVSS